MLDPETVRALDALNRRFYREAALRFDTTRQRPWRGWDLLLPEIASRAAREPLRVLDVGCGNGRFLRFLDANGVAIDRYVGIDRSRELAGIAKRVAADRGIVIESDLVADGLDVLRLEARFDLIVMFGVLHHVPGFDRRCALLAACESRLGPRGIVVVTCWRFRDEPGVKLLPWKESEARSGITIDASRLEDGDFLLPFSDDPSFCRYAHHFDDSEIARLVASAGFDSFDTFDADGDGRSNRYLVMRSSR